MKTNNKKAGIINMSNSETRQASIHRKTSETDIDLFIRLDGSGDAQVDTGIGFLTICLKALRRWYV